MRLSYITVILASLCLYACGQNGALYLPKNTTNTEQAPHGH